MIEGDVTFHATIDTRGRVRPDKVEDVKARLLAIGAGMRVIVTVGPAKTNEQLRYYFGHVLPLFASEQGHEPNELHRDLKRECLAPMLAIERGVDPDSLSDADLTASLEFATESHAAEFIRRVVKEGALQGITFPPFRREATA